MNYEIKIIREKDELENCVEVIREGFLTVAKEFGLTEENCPSNGAYMKIERLLEEQAKGHSMYGVYKQDKIVGYMQLEKSTQDLYFLQKVVVLPEYRHQGIGKILLDYAKTLVLEWGGSRISIGIIEENTMLKEWYLMYGFKTTMIKKFEHLPFTVGFMELQL